MSNTMVIWIVVFAVFVIAFVFYLVLYGKTKKARQQADAYLELFKIENAVKIIDHSRQGNMIIGHAQNISQWTIEELHIDFNYYDKQGYLIANNTAKVTNLNPGEIWEFKQAIPDEPTADYKIANISIPGTVEV